VIIVMRKQVSPEEIKDMVGIVEGEGMKPHILYGVERTVIAAVGPERARLLIGDATHEVALSALQELWNGDFLLLWKPPRLDARNLALGAHGESVRALRQHLYRLLGLPADSNASDVYDEELQTLVMQFQRRYGIAADGIAGAQTQALLDVALQPAGTPLLSGH
jgi:general secretion pathway protein A